MPTRVETIYNKITDEVNNIRENMKYSYDSNAFGHLIVKSLFSLQDPEARESITDGGKDNGIDAIYIDTRKDTTVNFFQFKFPSSSSSIRNGHKDDEIIKLYNGVRRFITSNKLEKSEWNEYLRDKHLDVCKLDGYTIKMWIVRYTSSIQESHQESMIKSAVQDIQRETLNTCEYEFLSANEIANIYDSVYTKKHPTIKLRSQLGGAPQVFETDGYKTTTCVCSINDVYEAVSDSRDSVFDGNVRFYNAKTDITSSIRGTLQRDPENFILYNNGITIFSDSTSYNTPNKTFTVKSASIINGAQTVGSILEVLDQVVDKSGFEKAPVLVRIIEIMDQDFAINNIVYSLNSQTKMFNAYSISNDTRLRSLQEEINANTEYFLEVKHNEYETLRRAKKTNKLKKNVIDTEKIIQVYVGYYNHYDKARMAKLNISDLFRDDKLINKILDEMDIYKTMEAYETYKEIQRIIGLFRSYRNSEKEDIFRELGVTKDRIDDFQFLTTADILILFTTRIYRNNNPSVRDHQAITSSIHLVSELIPRLHGKQKKSLANITKAKSTFDTMSKEIKSTPTS